MNIFLNTLFMAIGCSFISTGLMFLLSISYIYDFNIKHFYGAIIISILISLLCLFFELYSPEIALTIGNYIELIMKYYALGMLFGIWGFIPLIIITYVLSLIYMVLEFIIKKIIKNYSGSLSVTVYECGCMLSIIILGLSIMLIIVPIVYLLCVNPLSFSVLIISISIYSFLIAINYFIEYIICKKIHKNMIGLNEIIPKDYYSFYTTDFSDIFSVSEIIANLFYNLKLISNIIKKEPLKMYF